MVLQSFYAVESHVSITKKKKTKREHVTLLHITSVGNCITLVAFAKYGSA